MTDLHADLRGMQSELASGGRLRRWTKQLLRGATERERAPETLFDGADALDGDLWSLLAPGQLEPVALPTVWSDPIGRGIASLDRKGRNGVWIDRRPRGTLIVIRNDDTMVGWLEDAATEVIFAADDGWWYRATIDWDAGRLIHASWQQSLDGFAWDEPSGWRSVAYDDDGQVLAVHAEWTVDPVVTSEETLFERPVDLPGDAELLRRAHGDLVAECRSVIFAGGAGRLAGARLWQLRDEQGAVNAYSNFELCATVEDLLGQPPDNHPRPLDPPVIAPWSRRTYISVLEERLIERGEGDQLDDFVIGVVRSVNEWLEQEFGADGPVLLRCVGWVDAETTRSALTEAQWARWVAEGWSARIAPISGEW